jgi:hypothetical protein
MQWKWSSNKGFPKNESPEQDGFTAKFYKTVKKELSHYS